MSDSESCEKGTVFLLNAKSKDLPPGKGLGECLGKGEEYKKLSGIDDWRKKLSNFDTTSFKLSGKTWNSVEHYYQASKFKKNNQSFYEKFTAEANTGISRDPGKAKAAGSKSGEYKGKRIRPDDIEPDPDFFEGRDIKVMNKAQEAKFYSDPNLMKLLKATKDAKLVHTTGKNGKQVVFQHLMDIRAGKVERPEEIVLSTKVSKAPPTVTKWPVKIPKEVNFTLPAIEDPLAGHFIPKLGKNKPWDKIYEEFQNFEDYGIEGDVATFYAGHNIEIVPMISNADLKKVPKLVMTYDKTLDPKRVKPKVGSGFRRYTIAEMKEFISVKHVRVPPGVKTADEYRDFIQANIQLFRA
jgi:predicted NAD-dependent protein-ADP-ribosyltransferase YbiA (DUF1768 family)